MRIYLQLSPNREIVPFNYQAALVGAFHKWLGPNELHDSMSLYSLSWLTDGVLDKNGFNFPHGSIFQISAPDENLLQSVIKGILKGTEIRWGMQVEEIRIQPTPTFKEEAYFRALSPILIKRELEGQSHQQFFYPGHPDSNLYLTETLRNKMRLLDLHFPVNVQFDANYRNPKSKKITYKNIDYKATFCPVIISGHPRAVAFAWEVGIGNCTGMGFGALR
ncbi:MAG: CRISPR-associated endoribonuclease Cas6 [Bacteroidota bacterium]